MTVYIAQDWSDRIVGVYSTLEAAIAALGGRTPYPGPNPDKYAGFCAQGWAIDYEVDA